MEIIIIVVFNLLFLLGRIAIGIMAALWFWEHVVEKQVNKYLSRFDKE